MAQSITYIICGSVTHKMPNIICSYAAPIKFRASALNSGIKGLNNKKCYAQNMTNSSSFIYLFDNNTLKGKTQVIHTA